MSSAISNFFDKINLGKYNWLNYYKDFFWTLEAKIYLPVLLLLNGCLWYFAWKIFSILRTETIVLHYNVDFGINLIGEAKWIFYVPATGLIIIIVNLFLNFFLDKAGQDKKFNRQLLFAISVVCHLFLWGAMFSLYLINLKY